MKLDQANGSCWKWVSVIAVVAVCAGTAERAISQAIEPTEDLQLRIAKLEGHLERVSAQRAQAAEAQSPDESVLAEVERNITSTLQDLTGVENDMHKGPLLTAQLDEKRVDERLLRRRWQERNQSIRPPTPEQRDEQSRQRERQQQIEPEGRGRFAPVRPGPRREAPIVDTPANDREFHLHAAAHHLRLAGHEELADRLNAPRDVVRERRDVDRRFEPAPRLQVGAYPNQEVAKRLLQRFRARESQQAERMDELEEQFEEAIEDLEDRIEETEEVVESIERRTAQLNRNRDRVRRAESQLEEGTSDDRRREASFRENVRRFSELLQGRPELQDQTRQATEELEEARRKSKQHEAALNVSREEVLRSTKQLKEARQQAEHSRELAAQARKLAEVRAAELENEIAGLRKRVRQEAERRMELEEKLADVERDARRKRSDSREQRD